MLATLDPGIGAGHLSPIADEAVVVVTAGRSNAPTVYATGEMLRVGGPVRSRWHPRRRRSQRRQPGLRPRGSALSKGRGQSRRPDGELFRGRRAQPSITEPMSSSTNEALAAPAGRDLATAVALDRARPGRPVDSPPRSRSSGDCSSST